MSRVTSPGFWWAAGTHAMSNEQLGKLFSDRTGLDARTLKGLPETTDAPERLSKMPREPVNDDDSMRANMPKQSTKPNHEPHQLLGLRRRGGRFLLPSAELSSAPPVCARQRWASPE